MIVDKLYKSLTYSVQGTGFAQNLVLVALGGMEP